MECSRSVPLLDQPAAAGRGILQATQGVIRVVAEHLDAPLDGIFAALVEALDGGSDRSRHGGGLEPGAAVELDSGADGLLDEIGFAWILGAVILVPLVLAGGEFGGVFVGQGQGLGAQAMLESI